MSRRSRTRYLRVLRRDDSPFLCAAWAAGPESRKEEIGHIVFGKSTSEHASSGSLELSRYDFKDDSLSEAICSVAEEDLPRCVAVHPGGDGIICSFNTSCKLYELKGTGNVELRASERDLVPLQGIGPQNCLLFSTDGSRITAGGKDGHLRVFEWPSLKVAFDQPEGCKFLRNLDLSLDGAFLTSIPNDGHSCRVWDVDKSTLVTTIYRGDKDEIFGSCRFSRDGTKPFLFITITKAGRGAIGVWEMEQWSKVGVKQFSRESITTIATSNDGKRLAIGSSSGNIHVIEVKKMETVELVKDAHLSAVRSLEFSPNGRALLSICTDSTARVTTLNLKEWKEWQIYVLLIAMFLASALVFFVFFEYSDSFWKFPLGRNQPSKPAPEAIYGSAPDYDGEFL